MQETRYVLVTDAGRPVYTNGHKYSLRKGEGRWRVHAWDLYAREKVGAIVERQIGQSVRWKPFTGPAATLYNHTFGPPGCQGCNARDSVIRELIAALREGWIDLKSGKMKHLERIAAEVANGR